MAASKTFRWCDPEDDQVAADVDDASTRSSASADLASELRAARLETGRYASELAAAERVYRLDLTAEHSTATRLRLELDESKRQAEARAGDARRSLQELRCHEASLREVCERKARALRAAALAAGQSAPPSLPPHAGMQDIHWVDTALDSAIEFLLAWRSANTSASTSGGPTLRTSERAARAASGNAAGSLGGHHFGGSISPRRLTRNPTPPGARPAATSPRPTRSSSSTGRVRPTRARLVADSPPRHSTQIEMDAAGEIILYDRVRDCQLTPASDDRGRNSSISTTASSQLPTLSPSQAEARPNQNAIMEISCLQQELLEARELIHVKHSEQSKHIANELRDEIAAERQRCNAEVGAAKALHAEDVVCLRGRLDVRVEELLATSENNDSVLRAELTAECAAMRRTCHHAEERHWRHQTLLDQTRRHAEKWESEYQDLQQSLKAKYEAVERVVAEERRRTAMCEEELESERQELRAIIRCQLQEVAPKHQLTWPPAAVSELRPQLTRPPSVANPPSAGASQQFV